MSHTFFVHHPVYKDHLFKHNADGSCDHQISVDNTCIIINIRQNNAFLDVQVDTSPPKIREKTTVRLMMLRLGDHEPTQKRVLTFNCLKGSVTKQVAFPFNLQQGDNAGQFYISIGGRDEGDEDDDEGSGEDDEDSEDDDEDSDDDEDEELPDSGPDPVSPGKPDPFPGGPRPIS